MGLMRRYASMHVRLSAPFLGTASRTSSGVLLTSSFSSTSSSSLWALPSRAVSHQQTRWASTTTSSSGNACTSGSTSAAGNEKKEESEARRQTEASSDTFGAAHPPFSSSSSSSISQSTAEATMATASNTPPKSAALCEGSSSSSSPNDAILEAAGKLRAAMSAWEEVERAKARDVAARMQVSAAAAAASPSSSSSSSSSSLPREEQNGRVVRGVDSRDGSSAASDKNVHTPPEASPLGGSGGGGGDEASSSPSSTSWIRNKRPKFWAIVNTASPTSSSAVSQTPTTVSAAAAVSASAASADAVTTPPSIVSKMDVTTAGAAHAVSPAADASASFCVPGTFIPSPQPPEEEKGRGKGGHQDDFSSGSPTSAVPHLSSDGAGGSGAAVSSTVAMHSSSTMTKNSGGTNVNASSDRLASVASIRVQPPSSSSQQQQQQQNQRGGDVAGQDAASQQQQQQQLRPFRNQYKKNVARGLSDLLNSDPAFGPVLLGMLSAESRRLLLVMGTASEYFGENYHEVVEQVKKADRDMDSSISSTDYDEWVRNSFQHRGRRRARKLSPSTSAGAATTGARRERVEEEVEVAAGSTNATTTVPSSTSPSVGSIASVSATAGPKSEVPSVSTTATTTTEKAASQQPSNVARIVKAIQKDPYAPPASTAGFSQGSHDQRSQPHSSSFSSSQDGNSTVTSSSSSMSDPLPRWFWRTIGYFGHQQSQGRAYNSGSNTTAAHQQQQQQQQQIATEGKEKAKEHNRVKETKTDASYISWKLWMRLLIVSAVPFLAFGILDNATLILSGDAIDRSMSESLGFSEMTAAGLGGVVSGVAGIQVHGLAERATRASPPSLTPAQNHNQWNSRATRWGNTFGMMTGLILGMTPLLFLSNSTADEEAEVDNDRFRKEAELSRQRRLRETVAKEIRFRHALEAEEAKARKVLVQAADEGEK